MWRAIKTILPWILMIAGTIIVVKFWVEEPAGPVEAPEGLVELSIIGGNTLMAIYPPSEVKPQVLGTLIDCLEFYESSGDPNAVGKAGEIGCLQFMPSTFQMFCVDMYGLKDDIWDCGIQKLCASLMIGDKYERVNHWTTYKFCN